MTTVQEILERIEREGVRIVHVRFTDLAGRWRHTAIDAASVDEVVLTNGLFIDGSAVPGWRDVTEADLLLRPDLSTAFLDPFTAQPTLVLLADASDPATGVGYERDPRAIARRAVEHLRRTGIADAAFFGPEIAFFVFDDVVVEQEPTRLGFRLEATENRAASARSYATGNTGHRPAPDAGYLALPPSDHLLDLRAEIATILRSLGFSRIQHRHARATSQCELSILHDDPVRTADRVQILKYVVHQVAASYGKTATFLPQPLFDEPGSHLHLNVSLWKEGRPLFAGQGYADLSHICLSFVAGILHHARALNAFTNPTTNSYRRLHPGGDEPTLLTYAAFNRSAAVRIPFAARPENKRIELRFPDPTANPYLAFAAVLMAGLDGIRRGLEPGDALDRNVYDLPTAELAEVPRAAADLGEALAALEADHGFLLEGDVFPADLIEAYIAVKRREIERVARTPHPLEFALYFGL